LLETQPFTFDFGLRHAKNLTRLRILATKALWHEENPNLYGKFYSFPKNLFPLCDLAYHFILTQRHQGAKKKTRVIEMFFCPLYPSATWRAIFSHAKALWRKEKTRVIEMFSFAPLYASATLRAIFSHAKAPRRKEKNKSYRNVFFCPPLRLRDLACHFILTQSTKAKKKTRVIEMFSFAPFAPLRLGVPFYSHAKALRRKEKNKSYRNVFFCPSLASATWRAIFSHAKALWQRKKQELSKCFLLPPLPLRLCVPFYSHAKAPRQRNTKFARHHSSTQYHKERLPSRC